MTGLPRHGIPALELRPLNGPRLGACAQGAVVFFETAFFAVMPHLDAAAPILSCRQDHPQQNWTPIMSRKSNASSSGAYGSDTFYRGAMVGSENVGERIEHRLGRAGLK